MTNSNGPTSPSHEHTFVQTPSEPEKTSASLAFTQIPPTSPLLKKHYDHQHEHDPFSTDATLHEDAGGWHATANSSLEAAKRGIADPFDAYTDSGLDKVNEGPGRDSSGDLFEYKIVTGLFKQSDASYPKLTPEEMLSNSFGLIDTSSDRWENLKSSISKLQADAPEGTTYKLFFSGRHGEGWHNKCAEEKTPEDWEFNWAKLDGDGTHVWADAELTPLGESQALAVQTSWKQQLSCGAPKPEVWFVSPLTRTANTMRLSFGELLPKEGRGKPVFTENLREIHGVHTCDRRRTKTYLRERFPDYDFEPSFTENDEIWKRDVREPEGERRKRMRSVMDKIFLEESASYISLTSHSCALRSLLAVLHHVPVNLMTGQMIPLVVKAVRKN